MPYNDVISIASDAINKACLAALGASTAGVVTLPPEVILVLLMVAAATGTLLTHTRPVGTAPVTLS